MSCFINSADSYTIHVDQIVDIIVPPNLVLIDWLWTEDEFYYTKTNKDYRPIRLHATCIAGATRMVP
ncbi:hypothetical protein D5F52_10620 [Brevibacillus laterosporus]|nr:hypothetical protein D5F52_10620 [Brevibacillus laterosporus]